MPSARVRALAGPCAGAERLARRVRWRRGGAGGAPASAAVAGSKVSSSARAMRSQAILRTSASSHRRGEQNACRCRGALQLAPRRDRAHGPADRPHRGSRRARWRAGTARARRAPWRCDPDRRARAGLPAMRRPTSAGCALARAPRPSPPRAAACHRRGGERSRRKLSRRCARSVSLPPRPRSTRIAAMSAASRLPRRSPPRASTMRARRGGSGSARMRAAGAVMRPSCIERAERRAARRARRRARLRAAGRAR